MPGRIIKLVVLLMALSLLGVILVQVRWISNARTITIRQFDQAVYEAMQEVARKLERDQQLLFMHRLQPQIMDSLGVILRSTLREEERSDAGRQLLQMQPGSHFWPFFPFFPSVREKTGDTDPARHAVFTISGKPDSLSNANWVIQVYDSLPQSMIRTEAMKIVVNRLDSLVHVRMGPDAGDRAARIMFSRDTVQGKERRMPMASLPFLHPGIAGESGTSGTLTQGKADEISRLFESMLMELSFLQIPADSLINQEILQQDISESLSRKGISLGFSFFLNQSDTTIIKDRHRIQGMDQKNVLYSIDLFPDAIFTAPSSLYLYFPNREWFVTRSMGGIMLLSGLLTILLILTTGWGIYIILRQKKISDIKTDFINNMTHELKTPIATIGLAADAIANPKVIGNEEKVREFLAAIKRENRRMNARVEQVLQVALLDSRDFHLNIQKVNVHALIESIIESLRIRLEHEQAKIHIQLGAQPAEIEADRDHLGNVLANLLDNAIKYSPGSPEISIETSVRGRYMMIAVQDKGVGMSREVQTRIFDRFFRAGSGNIHNTKGFGLGLSYVKAIVLTHKGYIQVESQPGKGSRFEIFIPYQFNHGGLSIGKNEKKNTAG